LQLGPKEHPKPFYNFYYYFFKLMHQFFQLLMSLITFSYRKTLQRIPYTCGYQPTPQWITATLGRSLEEEEKVEESTLMM
jgi:hypothetical protein